MMRSSLILSLTLLFTLSAAAENHGRPAATLTLGGTFVDSGQMLGNENSQAVALGDLDGDADHDAFFVNWTQDDQVWFNDGAGVFTNSGQSLGPGGNHDLSLGDLDGDGDLDAIVASSITISNTVWLNDGTGFFVDNGQSLGTGETANAVALSDLDGDSDLDAFFANYGPNRVWFNDGGNQGGTEGQFTDSGQSLGDVGIDTRDVSLGDLDGDGDVDAFTVNAVGQTSWPNQVWLNNGSGMFSDSGQALGNARSTAVSLGNVDGDADLDAYVANELPGMGGAPDEVWLNDGDAGFTDSGQSLDDGDSDSYDAALADLDGDGDPDAFAVTASGKAANKVWLNDGTGVFSDSGQSLGSDLTFGVALGDVDGDGDLDAVDANFGPNRVWLNQGAPPVIPNEEGWQIQIVDAPGRKGLEASMVLDSQSYPHISYASYQAQISGNLRELTNVYTLHYARWDGVRWHIQAVDFPLEDVIDISLALDGSDNPHIAYVHQVGDFPNMKSYLRYDWWDGAQWRRTELTNLGDDMAHVSLALDASGSPQMAYENGDELYYAFWDGAAWQTSMIGNINFGGSSLALDADGDPHISYIDSSSSNDELTYAYRSGGSWHYDSVAGIDTILQFTTLALDSQENPHIGYLEDNLFISKLNYAHWDGNDWQLSAVDTGSNEALMRASLDVDASGNPHLFYPGLDAIGVFHRYAYWDGATWQLETLDYSNSADASGISDVSLAVTGDGKVHASYHEPGYSDLRYITWAPNWQTRAVPQSGTVQSPSIDVQTAVPNIGFYSLTSGQVELAAWDEAWVLDPVAPVANLVSDLTLEAGSGIDYVSFYDADNQRLMYSYRDFSGWHFEVVDESGDVGGYNDLIFVGGLPKIAYWDATIQRVKLAVRNPDVAFWTTYPNLAGPLLDADSGPLSMSVLPGGDIGVAYYNGANGDLRLGVWDTDSGTWTDELVDGASSDVGSLNSLQTDGTEGSPVIAYLGQGAVRFAYKLGGLWQRQDVPGTSGTTVTSLSLELGMNSREHARIAYTTEEDALNVASLRDDVWQVEEVTTGGSAVLADVSAARDARLHLAFTDSFNGLQYAFRTATLGVDTTVPGSPGFSDGEYNPLDLCQAIVGLFLFPEEASWLASEFATIGQARQPQEPLSEHEIWDALTGLFNASLGGQHYIELYRDHGSEMGQLGLNDPGLLWDAYGTLQNFLPGLEALVTGEGEEVVVTQQVIDDALDIWQRLAAAGSPELAAVINGELAQYNNLQDFVGLTFDEWALAIGVNPPSDLVYLPVIVRP